jgi:ketosteroid isomerase-like protein
MCEKSTTPDLVELSRCLFASVSRRDLDGLLRLHGRDAAWDLSDAGFGAFQGVEAIRSFLEDWFGAFEYYRVDVEEAVDLGGGVTFVVVNATGRPAGMDASVQQRRGWIARWSNGKVVGAASYLDLDQAREAAQRLAKFAPTHSRCLHGGR